MPFDSARRRTRTSAAALVLAGAVAALAPAPAGAAYRGANGRIAFEHTRIVPSITQAIFSVGPTGRGATRLTAGGMTDFNPAYSRTGRRIAFDCEAQGDQDICVMNADGSGERNLTRGMPGVQKDPYFSPSGRSIVFQNDRGANDQEIYVMRSNGTRARNLSRSPMTDDRSPTFSPGGSTVVFTSNRVSTPVFGTSQNIVSMRADGSRQRLLTSAANMNDFDPDYSPGGTRIVFARDTDFDGLEDDLFTMRANGGGVRNITNTPASTRDEWSPAYSPDGRRVVFTHGDSNFGPRGDLRTMSANGGAQRRLFSLGQNDGANWGRRR